ncbi:MAG: hypothetical protein D6749_01310 [Chloroflexota bacterium]|nr:MAG: hypothetical protein D6749_01310 [Chloroflexota bacterium]
MPCGLPDNALKGLLKSLRMLTPRLPGHAEMIFQHSLCHAKPIFRSHYSERYESDQAVAGLGGK